MKTPQEEIQFIVENTDGECLHDYDGDGTIYDPKICTKCGVNRKPIFADALRNALVKAIEGNQ